MSQIGERRFERLVDGSPGQMRERISEGLRSDAKGDSNNRFPGYTARYTPDIFALGVVTKDNVLRYLFDFRDEDLADRTGKAMWHAVELCGGQN